MSESMHLPGTNESSGQRLSKKSQTVQSVVWARMTMGAREIIGSYGQTLKLNRQDLCRCQVVNVFVRDIKT